MGIKSWRAVFYPVEASYFEKPRRVTVEQVVKHSLNKWLGLSPQVLDEYGLVARDGGIYSKSISEFVAQSLFTTRATSCALCVRYYEFDSEDPCLKCPIKKATGSSCAKEYGVFVRDGTTDSMVAILRKTLDYVKGKKR